MAFRFRRSMKLGPGLRMNVSKRGVGMSFGTTGLRSSIHSTGSRTKTIGIPGTGMSYVDRSYGMKKKKSSGGSPSTANQKLEENKHVVREYDNYIHAITSMHHNPVEPIDWQKINQTPAPFSPGEMGPLQKEAAKNYDQYKPSILERLFKSLADKKRQKMKADIEKAKRADEARYKKWKNLTDLATRVLDGSPDAYEQVFENSNKFDETRDRSTLHVVSSDVVELEVQVAPKDIVPKKKIQLTKTGRISKRNMGKKQYYSTVRAFVCSHAIFSARNIFASLPVDKCVIHMTETGLNTSTGHHEQRILLSVSFDRKTMDSLNHALVNPSDAMDNFQHHIDFRITKGFRSVKRVPV